MADYIRFTAMCVLLGFMIVAPFTSASPSNLTKDLETFQKVKVILGGNQESLGHISEDILEGKINSKFKYSNSISAEITQKDYDKLIKRNITIRKEQEFNIDLQDSTEIINATLTWATQVGGVNLTGLGQTICIIDTGANYSHPDLTSKNLTSCNIDCVNSDHCFENCSETDLNGHGTHVAGIAVASGEINGVAKGANFIALKVFPGSSSTGATESSISQAIDWCVNNASLFNISVISMSLGTSSLYSDYCDSSYIGTLTDSINEAASRNISVVASSGNDGELTSVSSPACIWNVTAVGNTKKDDTINSLSNRWSLSMLLAPGTNINSTWTSGYMLDTGTSMAAPHVSGTIAIIKQFLKLKNLIRSPKQIEEVLNNTGKRINDTTGLNYTRINLFEAISSLNPILGISITYPQNTTYNSNISMINYTATNSSAHL